MRSDRYWEERALQREEYSRNASTRAIKAKTVKLYVRAQRDLDARINRIFSRYAANGELTPEEARQLLNAKEAKAELDALRKELNGIKDPVIRRKALARLNAPAYSARMSRLEVIRANIETEMALLAGREKRDGQTLLENIGSDTYYRNIYDTQIGTGYGFDFAALPKSVINTIVNDRWKGANFSQRVWANASALAGRAYDVVARGVITGSGNLTMARQLDAEMQSGLYNAMRLIRTETNRVHNAAEKAAYEEEGMENYRFLATLDGRTCEVCGALDGKVFPVSEAKEGVNYPPLHPNDRCTTVAARTDQELAALKRRARDPETGETKLVPASMTYEEWLADNINPLTGKLKYYSPRILTQVSSYSKEQFERYSEVLKENMPDSLDEFLKIKYNNPEEWKNLKYQYRTANRYEVDGNVSINDILELDNAAYYTKETAFDGSGMSGKDKKEIKNLRRSGNAAAMKLACEEESVIYFSHSKVGLPKTKECDAYTGKYELVTLRKNRQFKVKDLGDNIPREYDTEAKFLEFIALQKTPDDTFTVTILSEKHICESCQGVVKQFKETFPNATVNIISGKLNYNGSEKGTNTWKHRKRVKQ